MAPIDDAMNSAIQQLADYRWPSGDALPIAILRTPLERLAERAGLALERWEEDGLGPARGAGCRLPSGRPCLLFELEFADGVNVMADSGDISEIGAATLVGDVLHTFGLERSDVVWSAAGASTE